MNNWAIQPDQKLSEEDVEQIVKAEIKDAQDMLNNGPMGKKLRKTFLKLRAKGE